MMGSPEILAMSLGLSLVLASLAYGLARLVEVTASDPTLRERAWAIALYAPALPVLLIAIALVAPAPVWMNTAGSDASSFSTVVEVLSSQRASAAPIGEPLAFGALILAGLLAAVRAARLAIRAVRLDRLVRSTEPVSADTRRIVEDVARRQFVAAPAVRVRRGGSETLVAGLRRPVLILPDRLIASAPPHALSAVCAHEIAHLKRGDHRTLWTEEVLLTILAFNPVLGLIRDHRAAAREEACDAVALAQAAQETRRLYARTLLDALRAAPGGDQAPALTFTSSTRRLAMRRLKAILSPAPQAALHQRLAVVGLGVAVAAVAGTGTLALAAQRNPVIAPPPPSAAIILPASKPPVTDASMVSVAVPKVTATPTPAAESRPAVEPSSPVQTAVVTNPTWVLQPRPLSYPAAALEQGLTSGQAELSCTVQADGRLSACTIVSEEPVGAGYGAAALEASAEARLSPRTVDNAPVGGTVRFIVRFRLAGE
jgi:TonB family protein